MKSLFRSVSLLVAVSIAVSLSACGGRVSFSAAKKASLRGANVAKRSEYPKKDQIMIQTFGQNLSMIVGIAVGGAIGGGVIAGAAIAAGNDERAQVAAYLEAKKIDPGLIVAEAFEGELKRAPLWPANGPADATFELKVMWVGLSIRRSLTAALCPVVGAEARLVGRDGKALWVSNHSYLDDSFRHSLKEYFSQPGLLQAAFESASRKMSRELLRELHKQSGGGDPIRGIERAEEAAEDARLDAEEEAADRAEDERDRLAKEAKQARKAQEAAAKRAKKEQAAAAAATR